MEGIYCGPPPLPAELWARWNFDPALVLALSALAFAMRRQPAGLCAVAVLALAFVSPLCALSAALFSARAVHHVLIVAVAAPLIATALNTFTARSPVGALTVLTIVVWVWHVPAAYDTALADKAIYWLMQGTLLASAIWFWRTVLVGSGSPLLRIPLVVAAFVQMGLLGAILTFAPVSLYAIHAIAPFDWGLTPLSDQQLAGLIMWVPSSIPFAIVAAILVRRGMPELTGGMR